MGDSPSKQCTPKLDQPQRILRPILNQPNFDEAYGLCDPGPPLTPWQEITRIGRKHLSRKVSNNKCGQKCAYSYATSWFPVLEWAPKYDFRKLVIPDLVAGITVGVMNIPQGIAYALLAGLPPVCGLYTSFIPTLFYFVMGTSRQCSLGTFAVVSMMTSKIVMTYAPFEGDVGLERNVTTNSSRETLMYGSFTETEYRRIQVGAMAALMTGLWQLLFGILGFGALTVYLSDQLVQGFTCSAAFHVFSSQLSNVFGVKGLPEYHGMFKICRTYYRFFQVTHTAHIPTMLISLTTVTLLICIKYGLNGNRTVKSLLRVPIPAELIVVIIGSFASYWCNFEETYQVDIVKKVPVGMPPVTVPDLSIASSILGDTFALAIVTFAITVTLGMVFAAKHNYSVSPNQEFRALGVGNIIGSFFQCFPSGASLARSAVQDDTGGRTQMVSLIQCMIVLVVILTAGPLLEPLPKPVLGSIVMVALFHLLAQVVEIHRLWKLSFVDWTIFLVVFLAVLILDVDVGVGIGVVYAIMTVMFRLQKPKVRNLGRIPGTDLYKPVDVYRKASSIPNVKIIRVDSPIYFANAAYIKARLYNLAGLNKAIDFLRKATDDTEDPSHEPYAFTNTLAVEDDEAATDAVEQFPNPTITQNVSRISRQSVTVAPAVLLDGLKEAGELELGRRHPVDLDDVKDSDLPAHGFHLIVDCSEVSFMDVTGVSFIKKTAVECRTIGVELLLANAKKSVRDILTTCGADGYIHPRQMFVTVHDAVSYALNDQAAYQRTPSEFLNSVSLAVIRETPTTTAIARDIK
ncbi:Pendrin [Hypsibius exemplaris]|uniref:Pendrin n=1 Tax=Hypsibius exemplaris TaxID=2072580 RepID=A0A1W0WPB1_HYPEX|nr:Pendrin [Hypsibius exemplaris]